MNKVTDILLVSSFAPRPPIASNNPRVNCFAITRTHLEYKGFRAKVIDEQSILRKENSVLEWWLRILRVLTQRQYIIFQKGKAIRRKLLMLLTWPVYAFSLYRHKLFIYGMINGIVETVARDRIPFIGIEVCLEETIEWCVCLASRLREVCPETVVIAVDLQDKKSNNKIYSAKGFDLIISDCIGEALEKLLILRQSNGLKQQFLKAVLNRDQLTTH